MISNAGTTTRLPSAVRNGIAAALACPMLLFVARTEAHHSTATLYDRTQTVEAEGTVTDVSWTNPHVRLVLHAQGADGRERSIRIESNSVSIVSRFGLTASLVEAGTHVKIAGNPGRADDDILFLTNLLLPSGEEILFGSGIPSRWSNRTIGSDVRSAVSADASGRGIFRVWTNAVAPPDFWGPAPKLTPAAAAIQAKFDPVKNDPTVSCTPKGMPYLMEQPYPIEFVNAGDAILLKLEEYDTVRRIELGGSAGTQPARLGRSRGRWEGDTLVVTTTQIDYPWVNNTGVPLGRNASIEERFTVSADGSRLDYTMTITDADTFPTPLTLRKYWEWRPGEQVRPYDCRR